MSNHLLTYKICGQYPVGWGGGKLLYISHITGTHKGCIVLGPFWSENAVINVGHFGLESGLVLEEPTGAYA